MGSIQFFLAPLIDEEEWQFVVSEIKDFHHEKVLRFTYRFILITGCRLVSPSSYRGVQNYQTRGYVQIFEDAIIQVH